MTTAGSTEGEEGEKRFRRGTHRIATPAETLARIAPAARKLGISRVANLTGLDVIGIPVVAVMRPNARSLAVAQGKGCDLVSAKVSGLMESIENHHAENVCQPLLLDSERRIRERGGNLLEVTRLPRSSGGSYQPDDKILWLEGHNMLGKTDDRSSRKIWLPFEVVHADYTPPLATCSGAFQMSDSGVASGNHPLEAVSHALCELVERDAVTLWQFKGGQDQIEGRVDLRTVDDDACRWALNKFAAASVDVAVWEITSDVGIPAFICQIIDHEPNPWRPLGVAGGAGCHPAREVALVRALTEAAQARLTIIAGSRDDLSLAIYDRGRDGEEVARARAVMAHAPMHPFGAAPTHDGSNIKDDVAWELERLAHAGIEQAVVVDLTVAESREIGVAVVRVVVPGLEGMADAPGFVPGDRLRKQVA